MNPTLGNVDAEAYKKAFKLATTLLQKKRLSGVDIHELSHVAVERFFLNHGVDSMDQCVELIYMSIGKKTGIPSQKGDDLSTSGGQSAIEATLDLYKLYLMASDTFSSEEKIVFFSLLDNNPISGIASKLKMSPEDVNKIRRSLLEKIKNAVPRT